MRNNESKLCSLFSKKKKYPYLKYFKFFFKTVVTLFVFRKKLNFIRNCKEKPISKIIINGKQLRTFGKSIELEEQCFIIIF